MEYCGMTQNEFEQFPAQQNVRVGHQGATTVRTSTAAVSSDDEGISSIGPAGLFFNPYPGLRD